MQMLDLFFANLIRQGSVRVIDHTGRRKDYGDGSPPTSVVRFTDAATERRVFMAPHYHLLDAFTEGRMVVEQGSLLDFLDLCAANVAHHGYTLPTRLHQGLGRLFLAWEQYNPIPLSHRRIAHHYDLHEDLFRLFLDDDMQYSCGYFDSHSTSLDSAQAAKKRHIAAKLRLADGQRILDIGCGWGGMALSLASMAHVEVLGITLSEEQLAVARRRAAEAGLDGRVRFELMDYRKVQGQFDRIVSVGMFEHVGPPHYRSYFRRIHQLLADDGIALLHSIGDVESGYSHPWIRRHIFPGSYTPALSQVLPHVERSGLLTTDVEILHTHYALTLKAWRDRFLAHRAQAAELYDERFCRMWEAYLSACEVGFRRLSLMVFQIQMTKDRAAVPLTRDYMMEGEREVPVRRPHEVAAQ
ncbi:MAG: class I SAM-dependent methyltransferase [Rhodospirillaceae bacterium]|nr:class I SAM-dependent methyltransferase [Rhodospirillales bacterium]